MVICYIHITYWIHFCGSYSKKSETFTMNLCNIHFLTLVFLGNCDSGDLETFDLKPLWYQSKILCWKLLFPLTTG